MSDDTIRIMLYIAMLALFVYMTSYALHHKGE